MLDVEYDITEVVVEVIFLLYSTVHCGYVATDKRNTYIVIEIKCQSYDRPFGIELSFLAR